ncbi:hypothetical protein [Thiorhodovibrio litoralis]|uniref:hypothetical protein n=1 Tax=Thiorhodovibrio litoralis TaxID=2952932 RepID=UPI002B258A28|nr:hypothetical protein [Thiorhodovibrio litoralis]WPL13139.1 hypothetical protein Thiosp_02933 [Thiorhodovibrio litoralis]
MEWVAEFIKPNFFWTIYPKFAEAVKSVFLWEPTMTAWVPKCEQDLCDRPKICINADIYFKKQWQDFQYMEINPFSHIKAAEDVFSSEKCYTFGPDGLKAVTK